MITAIGCRAMDPSCNNENSDGTAGKKTPPTTQSTNESNQTLELMTQRFVESVFKDIKN